jgi:hypothetical protein
MLNFFLHPSIFFRNSSLIGSPRLAPQIAGTPRLEGAI